MTAELPLAEILAVLHTRLFPRDPQSLIALYLFGSAARGEARKDSDVDLAFLGQRSPPAMEVLRAAGELMGIVRREVDLGDLRKASTVLRAQVGAKGRRIHTGDSLEVDSFEMYALSDYATLEEERRPVVQAMLARYRRA